MNAKKIITLLLLFLSLLICFVCFIEIQFQQTSQSSLLENLSKKWSHRGYATTEKEENTKEAIRLALTNGYHGVEIDVWYQKDAFFVNHEEDYSEGNLKLDEVFDTFPEAYFWLDLKNLSYNNHDQIVEHLKKLKKNKNTYFIESKNAIPLGLIHKEGYQTSFWIMKNNFFGQFFEKFWIVLFQYNYVSMPLNVYENKLIQKRYNHLNVLLWGKSPHPSIYDLDEVKIILDDQELVSQNR